MRTEYTMSLVMQRARSIRVTDVCRRMGYPLTEAGMNYILQSDPAVVVLRGTQGWRDRRLRAQGRSDPEAGGGSVEFLMRFAGLSAQDAMMSLLNEFEPDMARWVEDTREKQRQEGRKGIPDNERRPFAEKIREIRSEQQAASESREVGER